MDEKLKVYDDKMTKTINNLGSRACSDPCRTCQSTCAG